MTRRRMTRAVRGLAAAVAIAAALAAILPLAGCQGTGTTTEKVHSADVPPETYTAVDQAVRDSGFSMSSRNLRMAYGEDTSTVQVTGAFVAPADEGGGEFDTLTLRQTDGTWTVVGKQ